MHTEMRLEVHLSWSDYQRLYLEPGVRPSARMAASVARAMRDFMRFHGAGDLAVEHSEPSDFGARLTAAL